MMQLVAEWAHEEIQPFFLLQDYVIDFTVLFMFFKLSGSIEQFARVMERTIWTAFVQTPTFLHICSGVDALALKRIGAKRFGAKTF